MKLNHQAIKQAKDQANAILGKVSEATTKKKLAEAFLPMLGFLAPAILIWLGLGIQAGIGALLYLAVLTLVGEVSVKWVPLKERLRTKSHITIEKEP